MKILTDATAKFLRPLPGMSHRDRLALQINKEGDKFIAEVYATYNGSDRSFATRVASEIFVARIPERKQLVGMAKWEFAATDYTVGLIHHLWGREQLVFAD